jgi:hypothetical protein
VSERPDLRLDLSEGNEIEVWGDLTDANEPIAIVHVAALSYERYVEINREIHGVTDESCAVCGKPRAQDRRHDRDHDHDRTENSYGRPRGLACPGDWGCNKVMSKLTLERARAIVGYLAAKEQFPQMVSREDASA